MRELIESKEEVFERRASHTAQLTTSRDENPIIWRKTLPVKFGFCARCMIECSTSSTTKRTSGATGMPMYRIEARVDDSQAISPATSMMVTTRTTPTARLLESEVNPNNPFSNRH